MTGRHRRSSVAGLPRRPSLELSRDRVLLIGDAGCLEIAFEHIARGTFHMIMAAVWSVHEALVRVHGAP